VLAVADMDEPPLRLILGSEAYAYAAVAAQARAEANATWHDLSVATDRDDATAAERPPRYQGRLIRCPDELSRGTAWVWWCRCGRRRWSR
jgi:hypothetical protein